MAGDPKFEGSQDVPDFPYADYAECSGSRACECDAPERDRAGLGARAGRATGRWWSRCTPIPRCRPCRRTSPSSRRGTTLTLDGQGRSAPLAAWSSSRPRTWWKPVLHGRQGRAVSVERRPRARSNGVDGVAPTRVPTDAPESDGTLEWDSHHHGAGARCSGRRQQRPRLQLRRRRRGALSSTSSWRRAVAGSDAVAVTGAWDAMLRRGPQPRPAAASASCAIAGGGHRALGPEGAAAGAAAGDLLGRVRDGGARLRQRRLHLLHDRAAARAARRLGRRRAFRVVKMKVGREPERGSGPRARGPRRRIGDRRGPVRRRQRRLRAQAGAGVRASAFARARA